MARQSTPLISKSRYLTGLQCDRLLWMQFNAKEEIPPPSEATQAIFDQGHLVGEEARKLFPGGIAVEVQYYDIPACVDKSTEMLKGRNPVFEGGLSFDGAFARADVMVPVRGNVWDIIEVKSSTEVKPINLEDVAFQRYVYEGAGLKVRNSSVCHINNQYERHGAIEPEKLFAVEDVTEKIEEPLARVRANLRRMRRVIGSQQRPGEAIGPHCTDPYDCPLYEKCHKRLPANSVLTLTRIGAKGYELIDQGIVHIKKLPAGMKLSTVQEIQAEAVRSGKPHISREAIAEFLGGLEYPLYYLDFETFHTAIPLYDATMPWQQIPFQFSLHVQKRKGGKSAHFSYLGDGRSDPRPEFLRRLKQLLGTGGSIVAYNASFEKSRLRELVEAFPSYADWREKVEGRFVDLLAPFRSFHYYHPGQRGSASLKDVLPSLCGSGYEGYAIAEGGEASQAYLNLMAGGMKKEEERKVREDLLRYCGRDTEAMVLIMKSLGEISSSP